MTLPDLGLGAAGWTWLALVLVGASFVRGYSGFGLSALVVAGGGLVVDPGVLVPVVVLIEMVLAAPQWPSMRGAVDWRRAGLLFAGCLVGVPLGVRATALMGEDATRAMVALWVLVLCGVMLRGWRLERTPGAPAHVAVGFASGLANGVGVGGLPVAAFFAAQTLPPAAFRATLVAYFLLLDLWTVPVMAREGLMGRETLVLAALAFPFTLLGWSWARAASWRPRPRSSAGWPSSCWRRWPSLASCEPRSRSRAEPKGKRPCPTTCPSRTTIPS